MNGSRRNRRLRPFRDSAGKRYRFADWDTGEELEKEEEDGECSSPVDVVRADGAKSPRQCLNMVTVSGCCVCVELKVAGRLIGVFGIMQTLATGMATFGLLASTGFGAYGNNNNDGGDLDEDDDGDDDAPFWLLLGLLVFHVVAFVMHALLITGTNRGISFLIASWLALAAAYLVVLVSIYFTLVILASDGGGGLRLVLTIGTSLLLCALGLLGYFSVVVYSLFKLVRREELIVRGVRSATLEMQRRNRVAPKYYTNHNSYPPA